MRKLLVASLLGSFVATSACSGPATMPDAAADAGAAGKSSSAGATGAAGAAGATGSAGSPGAAGATGSAGSPGTAGATGSAGSPGTAGATGSAGLSGSAGSEGVATITTTFDLTETPLSENGRWKHEGLDWRPVASAGGLAYGTQDGKSGFDDSYAYLAGTFPADQSASAVIHLASGITATYTEVEILLRWRDGPHTATGYECNLAYNGQYAEIVRWPGPLGKGLGDFQFISRGNAVAGGVHDGDVLSCAVVGNVITSRLNGKMLATGTDAALPSGGAPGIGFFSDGTPSASKYGFTSFRSPAP